MYQHEKKKKKVRMFIHSLVLLRSLPPLFHVGNFLLNVSMAEFVISTFNRWICNCFLLFNKQKDLVIKLRWSYTYAVINNYRIFGSNLNFEYINKRYKVQNKKNNPFYLRFFPWKNLIRRVETNLLKINFFSEIFEKKKKDFVILLLYFINIIELHMRSICDK